MDFKKDKTYSFTEMMVYGFHKDEQGVEISCDLYLGENLFEAEILVSKEAFETIVKKSDDKSGRFEKVAQDWLGSEEQDIFLPDNFPEPVHCKLSGFAFLFQEAELVDDEFGQEKIYRFTIQP